MIKNRIFSFILCSVLMSAAYAGEHCTARHIWFGPKCLGQGGSLDCSGWHFKKNWTVNADIDSDDTMQNGGIIRYCYATGYFVTKARGGVNSSIDIIDPHGVSKSFYVRIHEFLSSIYILHDDIRNTDSILLNTPVDGDITVDGNSWHQ